MQTTGRAHPIDRRALVALSTTAAAGLAVDQITKAVALRVLPEGETVPAIDGILHWTLQRNPGAAFSIFTRAPAAFTVIAIFISAGIIWYARQVRDRGLGIALGLILAGALGNLTDRLFRPPAFFSGHVIDFIDFRVWPTFNVADMCVVTGAALMLVHSVRTERAARRDAAAQPSPGDDESGERS